MTPMKVTATYVYPVSVEVTVPDDATDDQQREALDAAVANSTPDLRHPVLHECSNEDLID